MLAFRKSFPAFAAAATLCAAVGLAAAAALGAATLPARADSAESILYTFSGSKSDGDNPTSALTLGPDGSFYGTTGAGGAAGFGTIYKVAAAGGAPTLLHSFGDGSVASDGAYPIGQIVFDSAGNLYGTTYTGGAYQSGTVYKMSPGGAVAILYQFTDGADGANPEGGLTFGVDGKLYGTAAGDGNSAGAGYGTIFSLNLDGTGFAPLYSFNSSNQATVGAYPEGALLPPPTSPNGVVFYGTCAAGGSSATEQGGGGTVFQFMPGATAPLAVLHSFGDGSIASDGLNPRLGSLQLDSGGNLYGVTENGGASGDGAVFELTSGNTVILHSFTGLDGINPEGGLLPGPGGTLTGAAYAGGADSSGTVFAITPVSSASTGAFNVLYNFGDSGMGDGIDPLAPPTLTSAGDLIGATYYGDSMGGNAANAGVLYKLYAAPPITLALTPTTLTGSTSATGTVTLATAAPAGGAAVALSSNDPSTTVPASVTIPAGSASATFTAKTMPVSAATTVIVTASYAGVSAGAQLTVNPAVLSSLTLGASSIQGGSQLTGNRVALSGTAGSNTVVHITSSNPSVASVPSTETIAPGSASHSFTVTTSAVTAATTVTFTATLGGVTKTATLTVTPPPIALSSLTLGASSTQGGSAAITNNRVYLSGYASSNTTVTLSSSNPSVASVPSSETIAAGSNSHSFTITTYAVTTPTNITITATLNGVTKTATLTVNPPAQPLASVTLSASSVQGGTALANNRVALTKSSTYNQVVTLSSSNPSVASVPSTETITQGTASHSFTVTTTAVTTATTVTITAAAGGVTKTVNLTVTP